MSNLTRTLFNKQFYIFLLSPLVLLIIPLIAMQFTEEVNWTFGDFLVAAVLLILTSLLTYYSSQKIKEKKTRIILFIILVLVFILVWVEMAVGIFDSPFSGQ